MPRYYPDVPGALFWGFQVSLLKNVFFFKIKTREILELQGALVAFSTNKNHKNFLLKTLDLKLYTLNPMLPETNILLMEEIRLTTWDV